MSYGTILVGTDGSETAAVAERVAAGLAGACSAHLVILTAFDSVQTGPTAAGQVLSAAVDRARRAGVQAIAELRTGDPADALMGAAGEVGANLIVVGDRGMGRASRFVLGGVPDRVSHYSPVDLLVVKSSRPGREAQLEGLYRSVLVATDGSFTAHRAASRGHELATALEADTSLVFVGNELIGDIVLRDTGERLGDTAMPKRVVRGDPADRICRLAREEGHDLIVVGNKGMAGARRLLLSAVPNKVSHRAPCDVLVCKTIGASLQELRPGEGAIVDHEGQQVAAFVDDSGALYSLAARCTHLGCTVGWNSKDRTWDCPCHGSSYDFTGKVLKGPAQRPLPSVDIRSTAKRSLSREAAGSPATRTRDADRAAPVKSYRGGGITVYYDPARCLHFAECLRGLPAVFDTNRRPWVSPDEADPAELADVIRRCPTGALHYQLKPGPAEEALTPTRFQRIEEGPLLARGDLRLETRSGDVRETRAAFCACGATSNSPFCDGACGFNR